MQTSIVLSQRYWFGVGDPDECGALSAIQCAHAVAPWLHLPGTDAFRAAGQNPDTQGEPNGWSVDSIMRGVTGTWPVFDGRLLPMRGDRFVQLELYVASGRPVSVAVLANLLPPRLSKGVTVPHQVSIAERPDGRLILANPWVGPKMERWELATWDLIRPAIMEYGKARTGKRGVWAVAFPTALEMASTYDAYVDDTPYDQSDIDAATAAMAAELAELHARIDAAQQILEGGQP